MNQSHSMNYAADAAAPTTSQVESGFYELAGIIESLHDLLGNLENRISSVLVPSAPSTGENKAGGPTPAAIESQVLYSINTLKQRVGEANNRIASMLNRSQV